MIKCNVCKKELDDFSCYEYRGVFSCEDHFDEVVQARDYERNQIIIEESAKTEKVKGFDFGDNAIGRENKKLLSSKLNDCKTESYKLKKYEDRL